MSDSTFLTRVVLRNYKSIGACDVRLGPLTFLVGPNGAGKSNFLDALRFVADALRDRLDYALQNRGGINEVRRRSTGHPTTFGQRIEFRLSPEASGHYSFRVAARPHGGYEVQTEECVLRRDEALGGAAHFRVDSGRIVEASVTVMPAVQGDRLYLANASGLPEFRPVFEALSRMGFYNLNPNSIRALHAPDPRELLAPDGGNLSSVLNRMAKSERDVKARIEEYLEVVVPGTRGVDTRVLGPMETIEFRQTVPGAKDPWRFLAASMSDGTLRALGVLVALFQSANGAANRVPLVGIEEPEVALHPAAAALLLDGLRDASRTTQVLVTSHSPDLLDNEDIPTDSLLAVVSEDGVTKIGPPDAAGREMLSQHLYTPGELLRLNQLMPDPKVIRDAYTKQLRLFDD